MKDQQLSQQSFHSFNVYFKTINHYKKKKQKKKNKMQYAILLKNECPFFFAATITTLFC